MTLLYTDPLFLEHDTGLHPERADRLRSVTARLAETELLKKCNLRRCPEIDEQSVIDLHGERMLAAVKEMAAAGGGRLDPDTVVSRHSYAVGLAAAGTCVAAVDAVIAGDDTNALCLIRPPGHHATPRHSMGFCLFNNIALAAKHAQKKHGLNRILIVDWDVHHGNGTQDIFYDDGSVTFLSIHRYGDGFYPGTGNADETGTGKGLGAIRNVPVAYGTSRKEYLARFRNALHATADASKPDLILLSAGFDAHRRDSIGSLGLEVEDFAKMTKEILDVAKTHTRGRLVSCLEGGYDLAALAESVQAHLEGLLLYSPRLAGGSAK